MRRALLLLFALVAACTPSSGSSTSPPVAVNASSSPPAALPAPPSEAATPPPDLPSPAPSAPAATGKGELDPRFVPLMAEVYRDYRTWGRVDDELRWAPFLCRMPLPAQARMSAAPDGGHARKLYSVLAKDHAHYPMLQTGSPVAQPAGQIIVKESFYPEPFEQRPIPPAVLFGPNQDPNAGDHFVPYVRDGEKVYRAVRPAGIYVLAKLPPTTAGTDAGWVYGTVTPEGEVTSAGRVASCIGCHVDAKHERAFGLAPIPDRLP